MQPRRTDLLRMETMQLCRKRSVCTSTVLSRAPSRLTAEVCDELPDRGLGSQLGNDVVQLSRTSRSLREVWYIVWQMQQLCQ